MNVYPSLYKELELLSPGGLHPISKAVLFKQCWIHQLIQFPAVILKPRIQASFPHSNRLTKNVSNSASAPNTVEEALCPQLEQCYHSNSTD